MTFIDPCTDWAFKRIFGSRESEPVLRGFLNDLLHRGERIIQQVRILDPYLPSQVKKLKDTAVDVRATLADGSEVLIEMQMFPVAAFCERVLYNGAKCLTSQLGRGTDYTRLRPVTVITVADCLVLPQMQPWLNRFALREQGSGAAWPASGIELVFIELPKVEPEQLAASGPLHDWLEFLKNAPQWRTIPRTVKNPAVREALRLARHDSLSPAEAHTMTRRQLYRADQKNMLLYAIREGLEQGLEKGRAETALEIAQTMLRSGMDPAVVSRMTGLTRQQVNEAQNKAAAPSRRRRVPQ